MRWGSDDGDDVRRIYVDMLKDRQGWVLKDLMGYAERARVFDGSLRVFELSGEPMSLQP